MQQFDTGNESVAHPSARLARKDEVQTEYNFARSQEIWDRLRDKMLNRVASALVYAG